MHCAAEIARTLGIMSLHAQGRAASGEEPPVSVLGRAVQILSAFSAQQDTLTLAQLVQRTGLPKTTVHRLVAELVGLEVLVREPDGRLRLGSLLFEMGLRAGRERRLLEVAMPVMHDLVSRVPVTAHLAVRQGSDAVYVVKIGGKRQVRMPSRMGGRMPLHATAVGKALLAFDEDAPRELLAAGPLARVAPRTIIEPGRLLAQLQRVREHGFAVESEESAPGLACVAAPILGADGDCRAALSLSGPVPGFTPVAHARVVLAAADGIATMLHQRDVLFDGI